MKWHKKYSIRFNILNQLEFIFFEIVYNHKIYIVIIFIKIFLTVNFGIFVLDSAVKLIISSF